MERRKQDSRSTERTVYLPVPFCLILIASRYRRSVARMFANEFEHLVPPFTVTYLDDYPGEDPRNLHTTRPRCAIHDEKLP